MARKTSSSARPSEDATRTTSDHNSIPSGCLRDDAKVRFWRDEGIDTVEVRYSHFDGYRFPAHVHDTWSVGLVDAGHCTFQLSGRTGGVHAGQIAIIPPGAVHACNPEKGTWTYRMFYVQDSLMQSLARDVSCGEDRVYAGSGLDTIAFDSSAITDVELFGLLSECQRLLCYDADPLAKQSAMTDAFSLLLSRHAAVRDTAKASAGERGAVRRVREYLAAHLDDKVTLDELAAVATLSGYHLLRVFRSQVGLTPHQWQTQLRINRAKVLLAQGMEIAETAFATGFTDQSHFTRTFRTVTGATPRIYRQAE